MTQETKRTPLTPGAVFEHNGHTFKYEVLPDESMGAPWKEHDGHGVVSDWIPLDAKPEGSRIISVDGPRYLFYDWQGTIALAKADGWGISDAAMQAMTAELGRAPTPHEIAVQAAEDDFERMREWCNNQWQWIGVVVTLLKEDVDAPKGYFETKYTHGLWGLESDSGDDYLTEIAYELAGELLAERDGK